MGALFSHLFALIKEDKDPMTFPLTFIIIWVAVDLIKSLYHFHYKRHNVCHHKKVEIVGLFRVCACT